MRSIVVPLLLAALPAQQALAADTVYLNQDNITVAVGAGTSAGGFNNTFSGGRTIAKVIDAPSAAAAEVHSQTTHIWFTADSVGGGLELVFDFGTSYDLQTLHFWNYDSEGFDVDSLSFRFYNAGNAEIGSLTLTPALGSSPAILAQDIPLAAPLNVRSVKAFLSGSNRQVDFQNIGFTAVVSVVPEPATTALLLLGLGAVATLARRRRR
jgi:PEP-CTERM motif